MNSTNPIKLLMVVTLSILVLTGCVSGNFGRLQGNKDVTQAFRSGRAFEDHRYYYFGSEQKPKALIGINETYTLSSKLWTEFDAQGDGLKKRITYMEPGIEKVTNKGYDILSPDENKIGIWYSNQAFVPTASIYMGEGNQVTVIPPESQGTTSNRLGLP